MPRYRNIKKQEKNKTNNQHQYVREPSIELNLISLYLSRLVKCWQHMTTKEKIINITILAVMCMGAYYFFCVSNKKTKTRLPTETPLVPQPISINTTKNKVFQSRICHEQLVIDGKEVPVKCSEPEFFKKNPERYLRGVKRLTKSYNKLMRLSHIKCRFRNAKIPKIILTPNRYVDNLAASLSDGTLQLPINLKVSMLSHELDHSYLTAMNKANGRNIHDLVFNNDGESAMRFSLFLDHRINWLEAMVSNDVKLHNILEQCITLAPNFYKACENYQPKKFNIAFENPEPIFQHALSEVNRRSRDNPLVMNNFKYNDYSVEKIIFISGHRFGKGHVRFAIQLTLTVASALEGFKAMIRDMVYYHKAAIDWQVSMYATYGPNVPFTKSNEHLTPQQQQQHNVAWMLIIQEQFVRLREVIYKAEDAIKILFPEIHKLLLERGFTVGESVPCRMRV